MFIVLVRCCVIFSVLGLLAGCSREPAPQPGEQAASPGVEVRAVDTYPGEKYMVDYKGSTISEGRVALPDSATVRVMPLDEAGAQIPHRVTGTVAVHGTGSTATLVQPEGRAFLEARLPGEATLPTTVTLALTVDGELEGTCDLWVTGLTPAAFE